MITAFVTALPLVGVALPPRGPAVPFEHENPALLGIVAVDAKEGVTIGAVVPGSPAERAGLHPGDVLLELAGTKLADPRDVDRALSAREPGEEVSYRGISKKEKPLEGEAELVARAGFRCKWLRPRKRGETGFRSPGWHAFAWSVVEEGTSAPTPESTQGKVVVIHAFQSW